MPAARRRPQTVRTYRPRQPRDDDTVEISVADCRAALKRRHLAPEERILLQVGIEHGDGVITFAELRRLVQALARG